MMPGSVAVVTGSSLRRLVELSGIRHDSVRRRVSSTATDDDPYCRRACVRAPYDARRLHRGLRARCDLERASRCKSLGARRGGNDPQSHRCGLGREQVSSADASGDERLGARIEKDPIVALKQMDPGALSPKRSASGGAGSPSPSAPLKHTVEYEPDAPLRGWPPVVGQLYPNIVLKDQAGQTVAISDFQGKVVLIELVGLTCKASHAFSRRQRAWRRALSEDRASTRASVDRTVCDRLREGLSRATGHRCSIQLVLYGWAFA